MEKDFKNYKLPAHLRKKDGYWHMIIDAKNPKNGKKIRHSKSTKIKIEGKTKSEMEDNETEARIQLKEFQKKWSDYYFLNFEEKNENKDILFSEYLLEWIEQQDIGSYTRRNYRFIAKKIVEYFKEENFLLQDIKAYHIQKLYNYLLKDKKLKANTILRYHAVIRKCFQTALKQRIVSVNEADLVDKPRKKKYIAKTLTYDQMLEIFKEVQGTYLVLPMFLSMYHGLRRSEALGVLWENIDLEKGTMIIGNTLLEDSERKLFNRKATKNKSSYRMLPLIPEVIEFLKDLKKRQIENKRIFKNSYNKKFMGNVCVKENGDIIRPDYVSQKFTEITRRLGYEDIHFHCLRHSYATLLFETGLEMKLISSLLGHSCYNTTSEIYLHLSNQVILDIGREKMKEVFGRKKVINEKIIYINKFGQPASRTKN